MNLYYWLSPLRSFPTCYTNMFLTRFFFSYYLFIYWDKNFRNCVFDFIRSRDWFRDPLFLFKLFWSAWMCTYYARTLWVNGIITPSEVSSVLTANISATILFMTLVSRKFPLQLKYFTCLCLPLSQSLTWWTWNDITT